MTSHTHLLAFAFACFCAWPLNGVSGAEATSPQAEELIKICGTGTPTPEQLKKLYLDWQLQRLLGKQPYPLPTKADAIKEYERKHRRKLAPPQIERLDSYLETQRQKMRKRITPLTTKELSRFQTLCTAAPTLCERLFLALDPATDNVPNGIRVALAICEKYPEESRSLENLTLAFAVVWDEPQVVAQETIRVIPELQKNQAKPCPYLDSFGWYVQHKEKLHPEFASIPWRLQIHLANEGIALVERDYVLSNFKFKPSLGTIYSKIPYDGTKLKDNVGRLGRNPYTLENLTKFGGLHRDQAYFASSVCRAFGVPAYMASGRSLTAGEHAWVGWIIGERKDFKLLTHGRDPKDPHFTTKIADPASGKQIDEYLVAIDAKGISDEESYQEAELRYRVWFEIGERLEPPARVRLLTTAIKRNAYHHRSWQGLADAAASGALPAHSAKTQWRDLCKTFMDYPD